MNVEIRSLQSGSTESGACCELSLFLLAGEGAEGMRVARSAKRALRLRACGATLRVNGVVGRNARRNGLVGRYARMNGVLGPYARMIALVRGETQRRKHTATAEKATYKGRLIPVRPEPFDFGLRPTLRTGEVEGLPSANVERDGSASPKPNQSLAACTADASYTGLPSTQVLSGLISAIRRTGTFIGSASSITKSARIPGLSAPTLFSMNSA